MTVETEPKSGRLNMRLSGTQEQLLRAAADLSGQSVTGFVLGASTDRARQVVSEAHRIEMSAEAFASFVAALDAPVTEADDMPVLRRYANG